MRMITTDGELIRWANRHGYVGVNRVARLKTRKGGQAQAPVHRFIARQGTPKALFTCRSAPFAKPHAGGAEALAACVDCAAA
jgi:hypothetical protein